MSITATLGALVNAEAALTRLLDRSLPIKTAYALSKLATAVQAETKHFHEQHQKAIVEFGEERETTPDERATGLGERAVVVTSAHMATFLARMDELKALEVTIPLAPLPFESLAADDTVTIAAGDLMALGSLLTEPAA